MNDSAEFVLCRSNIYYFMEKILKLELRGYQMDMLDKFINNDNMVSVISHRQCGQTLINCVYLLWKAMFFPHQSLTMVLRNYVDVEHCYYGIFSLLLSNLAINWPSTSYKPKISLSRVGCITFDNYSKISFITVSTNLIGVRTSTILSDCDIPINLFSVYKYASEKMIITNSTYPKETYITEIEDCYQYPWYCNPDLTFERKNQKLNSLGKQQFNKDFCCTRGI